MNAPPYSPGDPFRQLVVSVLEHLLFVQFLNSDQSEWVPSFWHTSLGFNITIELTYKVYKFYGLLETVVYGVHE